MITILRHYLNHNRQIFNLPESGELVVRLQAPWRISRTSRCLYWVKLTTDKTYRLVLQEVTSLSGITSSRNLYEPSFWQIVDDFLPDNRGTIKIDACRFYWSESYIVPSILDTVKSQRRLSKSKFSFSHQDILENITRQFLIRQVSNSSISTQYLQETKQLIFANLGNSNLINLFIAQTQSIWCWLETVPPIPCSWAYGGLWPKDIFVIQDKIKIIDWEWATEVAPIGSDIYELYLLSAEHLCDFTLQDSFQAFETDSIDSLSSVRKEVLLIWQRLQINIKFQKAIKVFVLLRQLGRTLADDGYTSLEIEQPYMALINELIES